MSATTKKINGVDCPRHAFAYAPDDNDTATWILPVWIPGDTKKTINAVKTSLYRFDEAKIPDAVKQRVFDTIRGAALAHGIHVEQRTFAAPNEASTPAAEPVPEAPACPGQARPYNKVTVKEQIESSDPEVAAAIAQADLFADRLLMSLGF